MNFEGKKLLIMGDNPESAQLVQVANNMGLKTVVIGMNPHALAKKIAYKGYDVNGLDVSEVVRIALDEKVDGVLVGVADILIDAYQQVCKYLGYPCYATEEIVRIFTQKDIFKSKCEEYGIHGIPSYKMDSDMKPEDLARIKYPVMVKPVDNGGGVGMSVCYNDNELFDAVKKALNASIRKTFIVEKYMQCDDMGMYYTFVNGHCVASMIYDRYTTDEQPGLSRVCLGGTYPSKHLETYYRVMHENAERMFRDLGIKNGVLMLSGFFENDKFYVYDTGFRLQGEAPHLLLKAIYGYDQRVMLINYAMSGSIGEIDVNDLGDASLNGKWASTVWFLLKEGKIGSIHGIDIVRESPYVSDIVQRLNEGDQVPHEWIGNEKQVLARVYVVCDTKDQLRTVINELMDTVKVEDTEGNDMLLKGFDADKALQYTK